MKKILGFAALALAAGCADRPVELSADDEARLAAQLRDYEQTGPVESCVSTRELRGNRSVGRAAIIFEGPGSRIWVNRPAAGCPDLRDTLTLKIRTTGTQFCRGDIADVVDLTTGTHHGGCGLGDFTPYERRAR